MERTINFFFQRCVEAHTDSKAFLPGLNDGGAGMTYGQLGEMVRGLALGLRALGMEKGARVGLVSTNRPEWAVADFGVMHAGCVTVALFPTLPAGQVVRALEDSGAEMVIVSDEVQLQKVLGWAGEEAGRKIVVMERAGAGVGVGAGILTLDEVMDLGRKEGARHDFDRIWQGVGPRDTASIVYTSGTTGSPLGAVLSHGSLVASVEAAEDAVNFLPGERIVSFLPLNHVLARLADHLLPLTVGASVAYAASAREIRPLVKAVRPHYITLVPRVLEMFREGVLAAMEKAPQETSEAFKKFFAAGMERLRLIEGDVEEDGEEGAPQRPDLEAICRRGDELVFRRIREDMGLGRFKFFVSGGAPLPVETARFFRVLGLEVIEGYGLTETTALVSVNRPGRARHGTVGQAVKGVEVRLGEDGEILVRGGVVMDGYWKRPEETAGALVDGWLRTGDMGRLDSDGYLQIGGRLKEIIVLSTGKNVAPLHVEERLCQSPFISQAVVAGDGKSALSALIVPDFARVRAWLSERGAEEGRGGRGGAVVCEDPTDEDLAKDPQVKGLIREEIRRLSAGLADYEQVRKFALLPRPFSADHGELTPTMKIRRKKVLEKYAGLVDSLYRQG